MITLGQTKQSYEINLTQGKVPGHTKIDKFGRNGGISDDAVKQTICEGCVGLYVYSNNADIVSVISENGADTQTLTIEGLDTNGNMSVQNAVLNGTNRVALGTPLWRVFRMYHKDVNDFSGVDFAGTIYCYVGTGGVPSGTNERMRIDNGNNQSLFGAYTIPLGKVGFLYRGEVGIGFEGSTQDGTNTMNVQYRSRRAGSMFKTKKSIDVISGANSMYQDNRSFPDVIPALTDIEITKIAASGLMSAWATLDIELVDESEFSAEYLTAIGQPPVRPTP